ncbi:MAG: cytochrome c peroxidase [Bacteroidota bacterium]
MWKQFICLFCTGILLSACQPDDEIPLTDSALIIENGGGIDALPLTTPAPDGNPTTSARVELGRVLFWDPILSGHKDVSCATCHHPAFGYSDGRDLPLGVGAVGLGPNRRDQSGGDIPVVGRNSPSVINTAFNGYLGQANYDPALAPMFWDNRLLSLENQALGPPLSFNEMRGHAFPADVALDSIVARIRAIPEYRTMFREAFGVGNQVSDANIGRAIAAFERTIVAGNSPFDRYMRGETNALNRREVDGMNAFVEAGCQTCHGGPMFSDFQPHALGVPEHDALPGADSGVEGSFAFRTPTLRNLRHTAPYFHNGTSGDLRDVMDHYVRAQRAARDGDANRLNPNVETLDPLLGQMDLQRNQVDDIIAFMNALNDDNFDQSVPSRVPSGLPVGGNIGSF